MEHATTTAIDRQVNPYWYAVFCDTLGGMDIEMVPQVFPAATDSRLLRALGIRALGFSPMRNAKILLHEHDEYILERNYLEGIGIYVKLIQAWGSQGDEMEELLSNNKRPAEQAATKKYSTRHTNAYLEKVNSKSVLASFLSMFIFTHFISLSNEGNP
jgi:hypothetical protein